jgi:hypothetical protein
MIVGVSKNAFNSPACLGSLFILNKRFPGRFQVRVSRRGERFHEKLYLMKSVRNSYAFIGSSNLTGKGLSGMSEMNVQLSGKKNRSHIDQLWGYFNNSFRDEAVPLSTMILSLYGKHATKLRREDRRFGGKAWKQLRNVLGRGWQHVQETGRTWFDLLKGPLPDSVSRQVEEEIGWTAQYASIDDSRSLTKGLRIGDRLILLESEPGNLKVNMNLVVDRAELATTRYRHFVKYRKLGREQDLTTGVERDLRRAGLLHRRGYKLDKEQARIANHLFGV